ncbi:TPA: Fur family transcriptional regulator [Enterococcus faecium]
MENKLVEEVIEKLKKENIRITPQRYAVLEYLIEHRFPNMSVATVYNNLRLFTSIGFVQEMKYGDASSRFDFSSKRHYHVICENCGKIVDFHYPGLEDIEMAASRLTDFEINEHRLELYGLCPDCKESAKKAQM